MKIYWLDEIKPNERLLVGEKAFALSQMKQLGYPTLPSFVISSSTLREFLEILGDSEPLLADLPHTSLHIDIDDYKALQLVAQRSRQEIMAATLPEQWQSTLVAAAFDLHSPTLRMGFSLGLPQSEQQKDKIFSPTWSGSTPLHSKDLAACLLPPNQKQSCFCKDSLGGYFNDRSNVLPSAEPTQQLDSQLQPLCQSISPVSQIISSVEDLLHSVVCSCEPEALSVALKQAWAELFSARSLFYWQRSKIELEQLHLAILVQPMSNAIASGTIEINDNRACIHSTWGTQHSIIQGEVLPDSYQIELSTGVVQKRNLGNKTIAYGLNTELTATDADGSSLLHYQLSEKEQQEYALDDRSLKKLIALTQTIASPQNDCTEYLEWTFCQDSESEAPSFYLTRYVAFSQPSSISSSQIRKPKPLMGDSELLLVGLAASPGEAIAKVQVLASDERHLNTIEFGRILVAKNILPHWLPLLKTAAGVVTEQGE